MMNKFDIVNVVGTIDFQRPIALDPLAEELTNHKKANQIDYDPSELHLIHSWLFADNIYVAFYKNGTCSVTGVDSIDEFDAVSDRINSVLEDVFDFEYEPETTVNNVVATAELSTIPPLETIAVGLGLEQTEYEPEQFPALIYRGGDAVILIFASGKIVCTGVTDPDKISPEIDELTEQIEAFEFP